MTSCPRDGGASPAATLKHRDRCPKPARRRQGRAALAAGLGLLGFLAASPVLAQSTSSPPSLPLPLPLASDSDAAQGGSGNRVAVEVGSLGDVTPDYAGTLEEGGGGFPVDMWKGTDRALVEALLPKLPPAVSSPAVRDLERRLLLTDAEAPAGRSGGVDLFTARAERLQAMGLAKDAAALLALMPSRRADKTAARLRIDSLLRSGDTAGACKAVDETRGVASADAAWQQAQVFCQLHAGQAQQAALGLDLLRDQGVKDPAFFKLAAALGGQKTELDGLADPSALDLAMIRSAGLPLPRDAAQSQDPYVLAALAQDRALDPGTRLGAAERAAASGVLSAAQLQQAYTGATFAPGDLADAIAASAKEPGPSGRALLYQATGAAAGSQARARLLQAALDRSRRQGGYFLAVRVNLDYLLPIAPTPDLVWFAADAGRALYAAGRYEQANAWLELARGRAASEPAAAAAAAALAVYARVAGVGPPLAWDPAALAKWRESGGNSEPALRLLAVFDGLGEPMAGGWSMIGDPAARDLAAPAPAPDPAVLFNLADAAAGKRTGETVLLAIYALGPAGPARCDPISLSRAIAALRQIGLDSEARAIALEALVASGV
ncbi:MAG TPA: hypothetical protein VFA23_04915 [Dongiaceae bacterium]|nr:hypothetical protein [Dongiaceae bacterium]